MLNINNRDHWNLLAWALAAHYNITQSVQVHWKVQHMTIYRRFQRANRQRWKFTLDETGRFQQHVMAGMREGVFDTQTTLMMVGLNATKRKKFNDLFREAKKYLRTTGMLPSEDALFEHPDIIAIREQNPNLSFKEIRWSGQHYGGYSGREITDARLAFGSAWRVSYCTDFFIKQKREPLLHLKPDPHRSYQFLHTYDEAVVINDAIVGYGPTYVLRVNDSSMTYRLAFYPIEKD